MIVLEAVIFQAHLSQDRDWTIPEHSTPLGKPFWCVFGPAEIHLYPRVLQGVCRISPGTVCSYYNYYIIQSFIWWIMHVEIMRIVYLYFGCIIHFPPMNHRLSCLTERKTILVLPLTFFLPDASHKVWMNVLFFFIPAILTMCQNKAVVELTYP